MIVPPEFIVYKPSIHNDIRWVVEFIDPPTQGCYKTICFPSGIDKKNLASKIEAEMVSLYEELGLDYYDNTAI
jgi:hypothetical protein